MDETARGRASWFVFLFEYCLDNRNKGDDKGGECGARGGEKKNVMHFGEETSRKEPLRRQWRRWDIKSAS
jgi:hypothetical protein